MNGNSTPISLVDEYRTRVAELREKHEMVTVYRRSHILERKAQNEADLLKRLKEQEAESFKKYQTEVADLRENLNPRTRAEIALFNARAREEKAAPNAEDTALKAEIAALEAKREMPGSNDGVCKRGRNGEGNGKGEDSISQFDELRTMNAEYEEYQRRVAECWRTMEVKNAQRRSELKEFKGRFEYDLATSWKEEKAKLKKKFETKVVDLRKNLYKRKREEIAAFNAKAEAEIAALIAEVTGLNAERASKRRRSGNGEDERNKRMKLSDGTLLPLPSSGGSDESNSLQYSSDSSLSHCDNHQEEVSYDEPKPNPK